MTSDHDRLNLLLDDMAERAVKHQALIRELRDLADDHPDIATTIRLLIQEYA